jgi:dihydrolipoamide dehydrogenase
MMASDTKLIIIGSGPGGYVAAIRAGQLGLKTVLVEKEAVLGGTCLHWGCIPTKAILHQAHLFREIKEAPKNGISASDPAVDMTLLMGYKQKIIDTMEAGIRASMKKFKVEVVNARGRLAGKGKVECEFADGKKEIFEAEHILLATGSEARSVPGIEFDGKTIISNREMLVMKNLPESLAVIGAGAVGVEFATVMNSFGKEVSVLEMLPRVVPLEDEEVSKELARAFKKKKIQVLTDAMVKKIDVENGRAVITYDRKGTENRLEAEKVLVATGRKPNTSGIGLEDAGVKTERGFVIVNGKFQTSVENVWAIGDIIPAPQLAHAASAEGINAVERIAGLDPKPLNLDLIPGATYCEPQIASVGLTETEAVAKGHKVKTGMCRFSALAKAQIIGSPEGFVKVVADGETDKLLGLHIIGPDATEMIGEGVAALTAGMKIGDLSRAVHPHPTLSEVVQEAFEAVEGKSIHSV